MYILVPSLAKFLLVDLRYDISEHGPNLDKLITVYPLGFNYYLTEFGIEVLINWSHSIEELGECILDLTLVSKWWADCDYWISGK